LDTIITSNLTLEEVSEKVGDRIASRIAGMCKVIELKGIDRRVEA
jgi:DNA replication protein DnaC